MRKCDAQQVFVPQPATINEEKPRRY